MGERQIGRPADSEFAPFFAGYVGRVPEEDILGVLDAQIAEVRALAAACPPERESFRYSADKWSIREVLGHVTDAERVFGYRAFCISRGDETPLPGFDENHYIARSEFWHVTVAELAREFSVLRESSLVALRRLDGPAWQRTGTANQSAVSVRALAFIMAGHVRHHLHVLATRYGLGNAS